VRVPSFTPSPLYSAGCPGSHKAGGLGSTPGAATRPSARMRPPPSKRAGSGSTPDGGSIAWTVQQAGVAQRERHRCQAPVSAGSSPAASTQD